MMVARNMMTTTPDFPGREVYEMIGNERVMTINIFRNLLGKLCYSKFRELSITSVESCRVLSSLVESCRVLSSLANLPWSTRTETAAPLR